MIFLLNGNLFFSHSSDSLLYYKTRVKFLDSLLKTERLNNRSIAELNYEFDKKEAVARAERNSEIDKMEEIYKMRSDKLRTIIFSLCLVSVVVLGFAFYVLKKRSDKKKD